MNNKRINKELILEIKKILKNKKIKKISEKEHKQINKELRIEINKILNNKKMKGGQYEGYGYDYAFIGDNEIIIEKCDNLLGIKEIDDYPTEYSKKTANGIPDELKHKYYADIKEIIHEYRTNTLNIKNKYDKISPCYTAISNILYRYKDLDKNGTKINPLLKTLVDNSGKSMNGLMEYDPPTEGEAVWSD